MSYQNAVSWGITWYQIHASPLSIWENPYWDSMLRVMQYGLGAEE